MKHTTPIKSNRYKDAQESSDSFTRRLLNWINLGFFLTCVFVIIYLILFSVLPIADRNAYITLIVVVLMVVILSFSLSKSSLKQYSPRLLIIASIIGPWGSFLIDSTIQNGNFFPLAYLSVSVMLCSFFVTSIETIAVGLAQILGLLTWGILFNNYHGENLDSLIFFLIFVTLLSVVSNILHHQDQETIRQNLIAIKKNRNTLRELSIRDALTGLYNRRNMEAFFERELFRLARDKKTMAVLLLDIDNFKEINDLCGHQVGDTVLMDLAKIFDETFRKSDIICRYGGDEFLVLMPESGTVDAEQKMTLFQSRVNELSIGDTDDEGLRVSVCCGIAGYPEDGTTTEALIAEADRALYQAKKRGPGSVYIA